MFTEVNGSDYLARQNAVHTLLRQKLGCTVTDLQLSLPDLGLSCEFFKRCIFFLPWAVTMAVHSVSHVTPQSNRLDGATCMTEIYLHIIARMTDYVLLCRGRRYGRAGVRDGERRARSRWRA